MQSTILLNKNKNPISTIEHLFDPATECLNLPQPTTKPGNTWFNKFSEQQPGNTYPLLIPLLSPLSTPNTVHGNKTTERIATELVLLTKPTNRILLNETKQYA
ncbi:hypothetical protein ACB098_02G118600 [Castanea mollissima]